MQHSRSDMPTIIGLVMALVFIFFVVVLVVIVFFYRRRRRQRRDAVSTAFARFADEEVYI